MGYKYRQGETPDHVNSSDSNSTPTPVLAASDSTDKKKSSGSGLTGIDLVYAKDEREADSLMKSADTKRNLSSTLARSDEVDESPSNMRSQRLGYSAMDDARKAANAVKFLSYGSNAQARLYQNEGLKVPDKYTKGQPKK